MAVISDFNLFTSATSTFILPVKTNHCCIVLLLFFLIISFSFKHLLPHTTKFLNHGSELILLYVDCLHQILDNFRNIRQCFALLFINFALFFRDLMTIGFSKKKTGLQLPSVHLFQIFLSLIKSNNSPFPLQSSNRFFDDILLLNQNL